MGTLKRSVCALCCALVLIAGSPITSQDNDAFVRSTLFSEISEPTDDSDCPRLEVLLSCEYCEDQALMIEEHQGQREYFTFLQNQKTPVFRTARDCSRESDRQQLQSLRDTLARKLQQRFAIEIEDELVGTNVSHGSAPVAVRKPRLGELLSLACALEQSFPAQFASVSPSSRGIAIMFLREPFSHGSVASWSIDKRTNRPVIKVEPAYRELGLELDRVFIHELAHNSSYRLGWRPDGGTWKYFSRIGWSHFTNNATGEQGWRMLTTDGFGYKRSLVTNEWIRCNSSGQPLSEGGIVKRQYQAVRLTTRQVRSIALVPPATSYFSDPMEHFAEGLLLYRYSKESRETLCKQFPALFLVVQCADQEEIDRTFGKGKFTRDLNGSLVNCVQNHGSQLTQKILPASVTPISPERVQQGSFR